MSAIISGIQNGALAIQKAITPYTSAVQGVLNGFGTRIDNLTNAVLPRPVARVVGASLKALPISFAMANAPHPARLFVAIGAAAISQILGHRRLDAVFGSPMRKAIYRGMGDAMFFLGAKDLKNFVTSKNVAHLKYSAAYGLAAVATWLRSKAAERVKLRGI